MVSGDDGEEEDEEKILTAKLDSPAASSSRPPPLPADYITIAKVKEASRVAWSNSLAAPKSAMFVSDTLRSLVVTVSFLSSESSS